MIRYHRYRVFKVCACVCVCWIGAVEVEGDFVVRGHRKGMVLGRHNIASIEFAFPAR